MTISVEFISLKEGFMMSMENVQVSEQGGTANKTHLKFSVIMPCYNSEAYVTTAIESIVNQTYANWELVAINDGSKDGTLKILEEYASKDDRIKVWSKENGGYVSAVNLGLEKITGDYFLLMGSDDTLGETLFHSLSEVDGNPDCIAFRTIQIQDGRCLGVERSTDFSTPVSLFHTTLAEFIQTYPDHSAIFSGRDTSKCYKRTLLGDLRYFGRYGFDADGIFSMLVCHNASSFAAVPVDGYYWTLRGDSLSGRKSFHAQDCDRVEIWTRFYNALLKRSAAEITDTEKEYLYYFLEIISSTWKNGSASEYTLIKNALRSVSDMISKTDYSLSLSGESRILLRSPLGWRLYINLPDSFRNFVKNMKKRISKSD